MTRQILKVGYPNIRDDVMEALIRNTPNEWSAIATHIQQLLSAERSKAIREAADVADGLRIKVDPKDSEGVVANMRASVIRDAILALSPEPVIGDGWRPIYDAPMDGTGLMVCNPDGQQCVARWTGMFWETVPGDCTAYPKFWMPLPPPPVSKGKD